MGQKLPETDKSVNKVSNDAPVDHQNETEADSVGDASEDAYDKVTTHSKL